MTDEEPTRPIEDAALESAAELLEDDPSAAAELVWSALEERRDRGWSEPDLRLAATILFEGARWLSPDQATLTTSWSTTAADLFDRAGQPGASVQALLLSSSILRSSRAATEAVAILERAIERADAAGLQPLRGRCLSALGQTRLQAGDVVGALNAHEAAQAVFEAAGLPRAVANAKVGAGDARATASDEAGALDNIESALALFEELGDLQGQRRALERLGAIHRTAGRSEQALELLERALPLMEASWDRQGEAEVHRHLAQLELDLGRFAQAETSLEQALALHALEDDLPAMAEDLAALGRVSLEAGRPARGALRLERALTLDHALEAWDRELQDLLDQSACLARAASPAAAAASLQLAAELATELGVPEADQIGEQARQTAEGHHDSSTEGDRGLERLLASPSRAALFFNDLMIVAEAAEDLDAFLVALQGQARALLDANQPAGAIAALVVAEEAVREVGDEEEGDAEDHLAAIAATLGDRLETTALAELRRQVEPAAEQQRSRAISALTADA